MVDYTSSLIGVGLLAVVAVWGIPFILAEYFPWRSLYKQRHGRPPVKTKSYQGRTALITGANGAFGSRSAKIFATRDIDTLVLVDVRSCQALKEQIEAELKESNKKIPNILVWEIDMMTFAGCQTLAKKARELKNLDHALMTMGILAFNRRDSPEGWETCESLTTKILRLNTNNCQLSKSIICPQLLSPYSCCRYSSRHLRIHHHRSLHSVLPSVSGLLPSRWVFPRMGRTCGN